MFYLLRFGGAFCLFYFGTLAVIGLSSPDNYYSRFVDDHLNFIDPLRFSLLWGAKNALSLWGYRSFLKDDFTLMLQSGEGVRMVYSCIGYGVMSFWGAFVIANRGSVKRKGLWVAGGWLALWVINVLRMALLLVAANRGWAIPLGWDHHTWFNVAAYALVFGMIYFYDRRFATANLAATKNTANQNTQALS